MPPTTTGFDPSVAATPFYFASMEVERRVLKRRAEKEGPSSADYTRDDAFASLAMGVGSLIVPLATHAIVKQVVPGKSRFGTALVATAIGATVATTIADQVVERTDDSPRWWRRAAQKVRRYGGPVAIGTGVVAVTSTISDRTSATALWNRWGHKRDLGRKPIAWALAFLGWDLVYYLNHRMMHEVRGMWAIHVVHHSSERYNLSTALRQPVADALGLWVPYGAVAALGVRPSLIQLSRGWNLVYQYWIHTDTIRSLGPAEEVLNTPSHHRVHHGMNGKYIDRNHGGILIIWDRLFGTFQREEEQPVYGLTKNIGTYNPLKVATHEYVDIIKDVAQSTTWRDRLSYVLRGPGWAYRKHQERAAGQAGGFD